MRGITLGYFLRRLAIFFLTIWIAGSLIWLIPHLAPGDPAAAMVGRMQSQGGFVENSADIIAGWKERFGLNDSLPVQYVRYLGNVIHLDFGYSMANFPTPVSALIALALPWTVGLVLIATIIYFIFGNFLGAIMGWNKTPRPIKLMIPVGMLFTSLPAVLAAIFLQYVFAYRLNLFPVTFAYDGALQPGLNFAFIGSVLQHGILPALSLVLVNFGHQTLGMRGLMASIEGEDYMQLGRAKGLRPLYLLYRYQVRNGVLPQITSLALSIGTLVSGQLLVEAAFQYQGMGGLIFSAIENNDYPVIQGTSFIVIVMTALSVLLLDMTYPLIDPRISYGAK
jgi:peptide/nickel transport system permease protein